MTDLNNAVEIEESALEAIMGDADLDIEDELLSLMEEDTQAEEPAQAAEVEVEEEIVEAAGEEVTGFEDAEEDKPARSADDKAEAKATAEPKKRAVKRTSTANMSCSDALTHKLGSAKYDVCIPNAEVAALTGEALTESVDEFCEGLNTLPKKVREKVVNLFCHINDGIALSNYTVMAIELLKEKGEDGMTSDDLRKAYTDRPYSVGTASAQSSQMYQLLPALGIAKREGKHLTLADDSILKDML